MTPVGTDPAEPTPAEFVPALPRDGRAPAALAVGSSSSYPLPVADQVKASHRGRTRISSKNQVTLPVEALAAAGLKTGDRLRADSAGPGRITLSREDDPVEQFAGRLTGVYPSGYLDELRGEWA